jgi:hypothetical protein
MMVRLVRARAETAKVASLFLCGRSLDQVSVNYSLVFSIDFAYTLGRFVTLMLTSGLRA